MGLFDYSKFKNERIKRGGFKEENEVEFLLRKSVSDLSCRPELYKRLLSDPLITLISNEEMIPGLQKLYEGQLIKIVSLQNGIIPIFTSVKKIFDNQIIKYEVKYLELKGKDIFNLTNGATYILNPYSDYSKDLIPEEIERILNGDLSAGSVKTITYKKETEVQIGQPAIYPSVIVNELKKLFSRKLNLNAAFLGWFFDPTTNVPPHLIIGLDLVGNPNDLINEADLILKPFLKSGEIIDFITVDNNGEISNYFKEKTEPFYKR